MARGRGTSTLPKGLNQRTSCREVPLGIGCCASALVPDMGTVIRLRVSRPLAPRCSCPSPPSGLPLGFQNPAHVPPGFALRPLLLEFRLYVDVALGAKDLKRSSRAVTTDQDVNAAASGCKAIHYDLIEEIGQRRRAKADFLSPRILFDPERRLKQREEGPRCPSLRSARHRIECGPARSEPGKPQNNSGRRLRSR